MSMFLRWNEMKMKTRSLLTYFFIQVTKSCIHYYDKNRNANDKNQNGNDKN